MEEATCKGSVMLGTACGSCRRCRSEGEILRARMDMTPKERLEQIRERVAQETKDAAEAGYGPGAILEMHPEVFLLSLLDRAGEAAQAALELGHSDTCSSFWWSKPCDCGFGTTQAFLREIGRDG